MVSVLTKSREKQFLGNGKNGHCDLEKSMKIKKMNIGVCLKNILLLENFSYDPNVSTVPAPWLTAVIIF